ncbi:MAG: GFA family protein [Myxococcales bacterium]
MSDPKIHTGGCHCGAVRFQVKLALGKVIACNCSICERIGALRAFAPATDFTLLSGAGSLVDYQFGKRKLHHFFCKACGVHSFAGGTGPGGVDMRSVNVRCLDGSDLAAVEVAHFDGKSL